MIRNFIISKNKFKKNDKQPDLAIRIKQGDKWVKIGGAWKRGDYYSVLLSESSEYGLGAYIELEDALVSDPNIKKEIEESRKVTDKDMELSVDEIPF